MKIAVIGAGSWGTTVAALACANTPTVLWARDPNVVDRVNAERRNADYLPGIELPEALGATASLADAVTGADVVVMGVPSHGFRAVLADARSAIDPGAAVISLSKGLEQGTVLRMTQVIAEVLPDHRPDRIGVLSGPNLAREVALGQPTASVVALGDHDLAKTLQARFMTTTFRVYTNPDVVGCEIAGALKNVIAIAAGIAHGLGYGDNTKAALITRGLAELARLGMALGGDPLTFSGLAGMGDLVATCTSDKSRNRTVGVALGEGRPLDEIVTEMKMVAEGVKSTEAVLELGRRSGIELPIAEQVGAVLYAGRKPAEIVPALMLREAKPELRGDALVVTLVGALAGRGRAAVDSRGSIRVIAEPWSLDWWVGADDRWRVPATEPSVRQRTIDGTPVVETAMRVPGGDALHRVYGVGGPGGLVIVEVENDSPAAFVVAFAVSGARSVAAIGARVEVDDRPAVFLPAPPARWTVGTTALDPETVAFETGPFPGVRAGRKEQVHAAVLAPLSHRSRLRIALATSGEDPGPVDLALAASPLDAAAGWHALLEHGMRVVLPDAKAQAEVALARSQVLLDPDPGAIATAALEDWGHDTEAAWAWRGLSIGARRAARRRHGPFDDSTPGGLLESVRRMLVRDERDVELAPGLPGSWRGQDLEVFDAPTRGGRLSYALRWHGDRAALLWEVAGPVAGLVLRAPALDPRWTARDPSGEALLGPVPTPRRALASPTHHMGG